MRPFLSHPFDDDKLKEECGIFAVFGNKDATALTALGLHALQHRGQEAVGITSFDGTEFHTHRAMGHVAGNFDREEVMVPLRGSVACGHVRYSTTGETALRNEMQNRFQQKKTFPEEILIDRRVLPGELAKTGELRVAQAVADDGWLMISWRVEAPASKVAQSPSPAER